MIARAQQSHFSFFYPLKCPPLSSLWSILNLKIVGKTQCPALPKGPAFPHFCLKVYWYIFLFNTFLFSGLRGFQQLTGTTAIIFYGKTIFEEANGFISSSTATIIYFAIQLVLSALSSFIVDFSGRRPLLIISLSGTALTLLANSIFLYLKVCTDIDMQPYGFVSIIALLSFIIIFSIGMQTIPLLMMGEIFPTNVKAFALCLMDIYYSVIVTLISKFFHWSKDDFGLHVPFFVFTVCCVIGVVFIIFVVPETKGKTLEDIQMELRSESKKIVDTKYLSEANYY